MTEEKASWYATALFGATAVAALGISALEPVAVAVALTLFAGGAVLMAVALVLAARRSRRELVDIGGVFFRAPRPLVLSVSAQIVIAFATAFAGDRSAAFGILVPIAGLGLMGLWGARHGTFPMRET